MRRFLVLILLLSVGLNIGLGLALKRAHNVEQPDPMVEFNGRPGFNGAGPDSLRP